MPRWTGGSAGLSPLRIQAVYTASCPPGAVKNAPVPITREAVDPQEAYSGRLELRYGACFHLLD